MTFTHKTEVGSIKLKYRKSQSEVWVGAFRIQSKPTTRMSRDVCDSPDGQTVSAHAWFC